METFHQGFDTIPLDRPYLLDHNPGAIFRIESIVMPGRCEESVVMKTPSDPDSFGHLEALGRFFV